MSTDDSRRDLAEALLQVAESQRATAAEDRRRHPPKPHGTPVRQLVVAGIAATILAWLWLVRPAVVFGPDVPPPLSAEAAEARARVALYLERSRIEDYRRSHGRLPASLADAGPVEVGVRYRQTEGGFLLEATAGGTALRLTDRMNSDSFVGDAASASPTRRP